MTAPVPTPLPAAPPAVPGPRHVICFGNPLHGDDGFGPAVARRLAAVPLPAPWTVHDVGTRGLDALALLQGCAGALLVDAAAPAGQPGRICQPAAADIAVEAALAGHGMGLGFVLRALHGLGEPVPPLRVLTAEMSGIRPFRLGLSPAMAMAVDDAVALLTGWMQEVALEPAR